MRVRTPNRFPWPSKLTSDDNYWRSLDLPMADAVRWYWRVEEWAYDVAIGGSAIITDSGTFGFNLKNSIPATLGLPGSPATEQDLPIGWGINTAGGGPITFYLFYPLTDTGPDVPSGLQWGLPANDHQPTIQVTDASTLQVSRTNPDAGLWKASAVVCTWDGFALTMWEKLTVTYTGTITITPNLYWEYRKSDTTAPVWSTAGNQLLDPHQTDELPSSS